MERPGQAEHDLFRHVLDRAGQVHLALRQPFVSGSRGGPPNSASNRAPVILRPVQ